MTAPLDPKSPSGTPLGDEVYEVLGQAILDGRLAPGERLRDQELAERLGVSRTPVREALQRLEISGLVEVSPNRYTRVSVPNPEAQKYTQDFVVLVTGSAAVLALPRADDEVLAQMLTHADALVEASSRGDCEAVTAASQDLFMLFVRTSANPPLMRVMREANFALRRNLRGWKPPIRDIEGRTALYRDLRRSISERDGAGAERALRRLHLLA